MKSIDKDGMFITKEEVVLFRIWLDGDGGTLDLMRRVADTGYIDAYEAGITKVKGAYRCVPRGRGKDIFEDWMPLLTVELLNPITTGWVKPTKSGHVYGKGLLQQFTQVKSGIKGWRVAEVDHIDPIAFRNLAEDENERVDLPRMST